VIRADTPRMQAQDLPGAEHERVAVGIGEDRGSPPRFLLRRLLELHALFRELFVRLLDVVDLEGDALETADAALVSRRREERDARVRAGDLELDPTHAGTHRLVGEDLESELLRVEGERLVLVADGDADEL